MISNKNYIQVVLNIKHQLEKVTDHLKSQYHTFGIDPESRLASNITTTTEKMRRKIKKIYESSHSREQYTEKLRDHADNFKIFIMLITRKSVSDEFLDYLGEIYYDHLQFDEIHDPILG